MDTFVDKKPTIVCNPLIGEYIKLPINGEDRKAVIMILSLVFARVVISINC